MKNINKVLTWISIIYIVITVGFNVFGYFHLPDVIATQMSFSGSEVNHMPTPIYLISTSILVTILSIGCITKKEQKLKYGLINTIIVIANIVMISVQL